MIPFDPLGAISVLRTGCIPPGTVVHFKPDQQGEVFFVDRTFTAKKLTAMLTRAAWWESHCPVLQMSDELWAAWRASDGTMTPGEYRQEIMHRMAEKIAAKWRQHWEDYFIGRWT